MTWEKPDDCFRLIGRGWIAYYRLNPGIKAGVLRAMVGEEISICGETHKIKDVETFAVGDERPVSDVGFLIEGDDVNRPAFAQ